MKLTYRGTQYPSGSTLPSSETSIAGCYRGVAMTVQHPSKLPVQPLFNLKYRGACYYPAATPNFGGDMAIAF